MSAPATIDERRSVEDAPCRCGGTYSVHDGKIERGGRRAPGLHVIHSLPPCRDFVQLSIRDFLRWVQM